MGTVAAWVVLTMLPPVPWFAARDIELGTVCTILLLQDCCVCLFSSMLASCSCCMVSIVGFSLWLLLCSLQLLHSSLPPWWRGCNLWVHQSLL